MAWKNLNKQRESKGSLWSYSTNHPSPQATKEVIAVTNRILSLTLFLLILGMTSSGSADAPIDISTQTTWQEYWVHTSIDKKKSDCSEMIIAGDRIRIGAYIRNGKNLETEFLDTRRRKIQKCTFRREEKVIVSGMFLKDGTVMAFSIQKEIKRDL